MQNVLSETKKVKHCILKQRTDIQQLPSVILLHFLHNKSKTCKHTHTYTFMCGTKACFQNSVWNVIRLDRWISDNQSLMKCTV